MSQFDQQHLRELGFVGFWELADAANASVPRASGIYVVLLDPPSARFLERSVGGHFKGNDPTVPAHQLSGRLVTGTPTVYIGRGNDLARRIRLLARYGCGEPVAHQGGRYLWQLAEHRRLQVAWRLDQDPVGAEAELLEQFEAVFGQLPFANLIRGRRSVALV